MTSLPQGLQASNNKDTFPLLSLPYVPLIRILRYLDEESVRQTELMCKILRLFIENHRSKMVETFFDEITIRRVRNRLSQRTCDGDDVVIEVEFQRSFVTPPIEQSSKIYFFDRAGSLLSPEESTTLEKIEVEEEKINYRSSFCEWISSKFVNIATNYLTISQIYLRPEDIAHLEAAFHKKEKPCVYEVLAEKTIYSEEHLKRLLRFLKIFSPHWLLVEESNMDAARFLMTPHFLDYISTLGIFCFAREDTDEEVFFESTETIDVPSSFYKFPPSFRLLFGFVVTVSHVKMAVREWLQNRVNDIVWNVHLPIQYANEDLFLAELGLPYEFADHRGYNLKIDTSRELHVWRFRLRVDEMPNYSCWEIVGSCKRV